MAAILRSGKFLRLFGGIARNLAAGPNKADDNVVLPSHGIVLDKFFSQASFSIQNVLPYIGVSDSGHAEDRFPTRLISCPSKHLGRVSKSEIEIMIQEIEITEACDATMNLLSSQALLAIRLCGNTLDQEVPSVRSDLVSKIWSLLDEKKIPVSEVHYNALLRVHLENGHNFDPGQMLEDMDSRNDINPDKETFQCLISRHCQQGDIDGASKILQRMKLQGLKINENIFNSLIIGHGEAGDMSRAYGMLKLMKQWGLTPSQETYLTLACAYAKHGDWQNMKKVMEESESHGKSFKDGDFLELIYVVSEGDHKELVGKLLALTKPEMEEFSSMASHLVVRLVNGGHDDVGYNVVKYTVDQSCEIGGFEVANAFLEQIVRVERPMSKLLWIANNMAEHKILAGGLDLMLNFAIHQSNFNMSFKLAEVLISECGTIEKDIFDRVFSLARKTKAEENILKCVQVGKQMGFMSTEVLKTNVFPYLNNWPELVVTSLEDVGLDRKEIVTPLIEWLKEKGRADAAKSVSEIYQERAVGLSSLLASSGSELCFQSPIVEDEVSLKDLEKKVESKESSLVSRADAYLRLLLMYASKGATDQAIKLLLKLKNEDKLHLPQFYDMFGYLIEPQLPKFPIEDKQSCHVSTEQMQVIQSSQVIPVQPYTSGIIINPFYQESSEASFQALSGAAEYDTRVSTPHSTSSGHPSTYSDQSKQSALVSESLSIPHCSIDAVVPDYAISKLHRHFKRSITFGDAREGYLAYVNLESRGKSVNVTESSSLIEQLVKSDLISEASDVTKTMLMRKTHPLPKIFRYLLNKMAINGSVEAMLEIGQFLSTKTKKDISFDNRLCNAYLSAGRGVEFLECLLGDLEAAINSNNESVIQTVKEQFPRGGALGLLDTNPEVLQRFTYLAEKYASIGYPAPMNVLWTYHYIHGNHDIATNIWKTHVKDSNQIMFQKVCQIARTTGNIELAFGLVNHLSEAGHVTSGAKGIAYSCLLDCLCVAKQHRKGCAVLKSAIDESVCLEDINRTALLRLKQGLEEDGLVFPYKIPPKATKKDLVSMDAVDWNEF